MKSFLHPGLLLTTCALLALGSLHIHLEQRSEPAPTTPSARTTKKLHTQKRSRIKGALRQDQPDEFAKFFQAIRTADDQTAPDYQANYRKIELDNARRRAGKSQITLPWQERGPGNVAGRARVIVVDPDDPTFSTWYIGSASGGIWKTVNRGQTFVELTSDLQNLATTTLVMPKSNSNVLYAGTGEGFGTFAFIYGQGIWKSENKGNSWTQLASTATDNKFTNVMRMVVDPSDEKVIVVATSTGGRNNTGEIAYIFKSTDGGLSWTETYQRAAQGPGRVEDLIANPLNFNTLFATVKGRGILKSTDAGATWTEIFAPFSGVGRMEIAIAPSDTTHLYVAADGSSQSFLYKSADSGQTWVRTTESNGNDLDWLGGQGFYDNAIAVDPFDANRVLVGGIDIIEAQVSGSQTTLTPVTDGYGRYGGDPKGVHVDHHHIQFFVTDDTQQEYLLLNANDGGISFSTDNGATFSQTGGSGLAGLNTAQFYGVDKRNGSARYVGGTQDNGSWVSPTDPNDLTAWQPAPSGDGFEAAWHYHEPDWLLETAQFNTLFRSTNGGTSWDFVDVPGSGPFLTRIAKSNQDPDLILMLNSAGAIRSENFGDSWQEVPIQNFRLGSEIGNGTVRISLADPNIVWAGTRLSSANATLNVSTDGGQSFTPTNRYGVVTMGAITDIATHPTEPNTAFALFSFAGRPKILKTTDLGQTWTDISGFGANGSSDNGFPDVTTYSLLVMPYDPNIVWAGTEIGLFVSDDGGDSWVYSDSGLPAVAIWQMRIVNDEVVLATHGRGIWSVSLSELLGYEPQALNLKPILSKITSGLGGNLSFSVTVRGDYDSTIVFADAQEAIRLPGSTGRTVVPVQTTVPVASVRDVPIHAVSYIDGDSVSSTVSTVTLFPAVEAQDSFGTNFDGAGLSFHLDGMSISSVPGFDTGVLHTAHPYVNLEEVTATLLQPVVLGTSEATLTYADVVIVEPGADGTVFGDEDFFDFVVVEGSNDSGISWTPIADGYDSRADPAWLSAYNTNSSGDKSLFVQHQINLLDTFSPQDTLLIRFRLVADPLVTGWGWAVDSLGIQTEVLTAVEELAPNKLALHPNFPNPFRESTSIQYSVADNGDVVTVEIYDIAGRRVRTLLRDHRAEPGLQVVTWDGRSDAGSPLAAGSYVCRITEGRSRSESQLITLLR